MGNAASHWIRDGEFVRFPNYDVVGNDQAYYPKLEGNVSALKKVVLENEKNVFYAFNTGGWIKSWSTLNYDNFSESPGQDLYVRVEYLGWYFAQGMFPNPYVIAGL